MARPAERPALELVCSRVVPEGASPFPQGSSGACPSDQARQPCTPAGAFLPARWLASGAAVRGDAYLYGARLERSLPTTRATVHDASTMLPEGGSADFATLDCLHRLTVLQRPSSSGAGSPLRLECRRVGCLGVGPEGGLFGHSALPRAPAQLPPPARATLLLLSAGWTTE